MPDTPPKKKRTTVNEAIAKGDKVAETIKEFTPDEVDVMIDRGRQAAQIWLSFAAMLMFGVINGVFGYLNWLERSEMRAEQNMTRTMLNARATIQMILIDAAKAGRPLTPDEVRIVDRLYVPAEYDTERRTR